MYSVRNQLVERAIEGVNPLYGVRLEDAASGELYEGDVIFETKTELASTTLSDDIELGAVCSQSLKVQLYGAKNKNLPGRTFDYYIYCRKPSGEQTTYGELAAYTHGQLGRVRIENISTIVQALCNEFIPLGTFICVRHRKNGDVSEIELYDRLYFSDDIYICGISLPASSRDIENDICSQLGCGNGNSYSDSAYLFDLNDAALYDSNGDRLKTGNFDFIISSIPEKCTKRQMLSYIAAAHGQFGFIDRFGRYVRKWYGKSVKQLSKDTIDEPTISEKPNRVTGVICTVNGTVLTAGNTDRTQGRVLEFENPYMTESLFDSLFARINELIWYTSEVSMRLGDPRFDIGDVVTYRDIDSGTVCTIPLTGLRTQFSGGFSADISAVGLSEEELL